MDMYYCWITGLLPSYQDNIIAGLVSKGYMVGAAAKDGKVISSLHEQSPSSLIAITVYSINNTALNASIVYHDLINILQEMKAFFYSVVVALSYDSMWNGPNFSFKTADKESSKKSDIN